MQTISGPDGSVLAQFAADAQDTQILAKRVHEMPADRSTYRICRSRCLGPGRRLGLVGPRPGPVASGSP
ncbi:hypothetical protein AB0945_36610 [Streptomyces sp. NPDC005474]|uniref:hypothetical protein n=1 Tax=Streptomyces sp. NPDC005474 TaxID=3154878 RepID=UPI00345129C0